MKKRKRSKKILLIVLAIIIAAILIFAYVQRNNIRAIIYAGMYNQEELRQKNEEVDNQLHSVVQKLPDINVQPLTAEDRQKLNSGQLSEEDAIAIITGTTLPQQPQDPTPLPDELAAGTENIPTTEKTEESLPEEEEIPKIKDIFVKYCNRRSAVKPTTESLGKNLRDDYVTESVTVGGATFFVVDVNDSFKF